MPEPGNDDVIRKREDIEKLELFENIWEVTELPKMDWQDVMDAEKLKTQLDALRGIKRK